MAGLGRSDALSIYDGANFLSSQLLQRFDAKTFRLDLQPKNQIQQHPTVVLPISTNTYDPSIMGIHLRATAADGLYGFLAEVSILPSAPISSMFIKFKFF